MSDEVAKSVDSRIDSDSLRWQQAESRVMEQAKRNTRQQICFATILMGFGVATMEDVFPQGVPEPPTLLRLRDVPPRPAAVDAALAERKAKEAQAVAAREAAKVAAANASDEAKANAEAARRAALEAKHAALEAQQRQREAAAAAAAASSSSGGASSSGMLSGQAGGKQPIEEPVASSSSTGGSGGGLVSSIGSFLRFRWLGALNPFKSSTPKETPTNSVFTHVKQQQQQQPQQPKNLRDVGTLTMEQEAALLLEQAKQKAEMEERMRQAEEEAANVAKLEQFAALEEGPKHHPEEPPARPKIVITDKLTPEQIGDLDISVAKARDDLLKMEKSIHDTLQTVETARWKYLVPDVNMACKEECAKVAKCYHEATKLHIRNVIKEKNRVKQERKLHDAQLQQTQPENRYQYSKDESREVDDALTSVYGPSRVNVEALMCSSVVDSLVACSQRSGLKHAADGKQPQA